ncbi:MAG: hypothetical protein IKN54_08695 [Lachnospiraceae bacterium]|nr:hypothetical protein [Lachnospiraceae bacterium]
MENMKIEILNSMNIPYTKTAFADELKCKRSELDFVDILTTRLSNDFIIDNEGCLVGNKNEQYCGRWFLDNKIIFVGRYFKATDTELMNKLVVGFLILDKGRNHYLETIPTINFKKEKIFLLVKKNNYCEQYVNNDEGTWIYIILDDIYKLSISEAYKKIKKLIWKAIKCNIS